MRRYQIHVRGHLRDSWSAWFDDWSLQRHQDGTMTITGIAVDQPALMGLLNRLHQVGLPLISVICTDFEQHDYPDERTQLMRYLMFVYSNPNAEERPMDEWMAFHNQYGASGQMQVAERLHPVSSAQTVRAGGVSEGTPVNGDTFVSGVYIFECADMDEALKIAADCPASQSGAVEVRPIFMPPGS